MERSDATLGQFATSKQLARRILIIFENRLELLLLEVEQGNAGLFRALLLALGMAAFGLLAGVALTGAVLVIFWNVAPLMALLTLAAVYGGTVLFFYSRLAQ